MLLNKLNLFILVLLPFAVITTDTCGGGFTTYVTMKFSRFTMNNSYGCLLDCITWKPEAIKIPFTSESSNQTVKFILKEHCVETITNEFIENLLKSYPGLKVMAFKDVEFESLDQTTFEGAGNMDKLVLHEVTVETLTDFIFQNMSELETLIMNKNRLKSIDQDAFFGLDNLVYLNLKLNELSSLDGNIFRHVRNLDRLLLGDNKLVHIEADYFVHLPIVKQIHLDSNLLQNVTGNIFEKNLRLIIVDLGDNGINYIQETVLDDLKRLKKLDLSNNDCVDQLFELYKIESESVKSILEATLYPLCNGNYSASSDGLNIEWFEILVLSISIMTVIFIIICIFNSRSKKRGVPANDNEEGAETTIQEVISEYTNQSSVHGVRYLGDQKRHWIEKTFWLPIFLISISLVSYFILRIYVKWRQSPVVIGLENEPTLLHSIPFPSITICPENKVEFKHLPRENLYPEGMRNMTNIHYVEALSQVCPFIYDLVNSNRVSFNGGNESKYGEILSKISINTVHKRNFKWKGLEGNNVFYFSQILTDVGVCVSFNLVPSSDIFKDSLDPEFLASIEHDLIDSMAKKIQMWKPNHDYGSKLTPFKTYPVRLLESGADSGFYIELQMAPDDMIIPCEKGFAETDGYKVLVHYPSDWPLVSKNGIQISHNEVNKIIIKPEIITTMSSLNSYQPKYRKCYFPGEYELKYFKIYSKSNCELECLTDFTLSVCKCAAFYMPRENGTRVCSFKDIGCLRTIKKNSFIGRFNDELESGHCVCLPSCKSIKYNLELSQSKLNGPSRYKRAVSTEILVYFDDDEFFALQRSEVYDFLDFISSTGGLLGLFMGVSMLSFIEMIYHFTLRFACNIFKTKKQN